MQRTGHRQLKYRAVGRPSPNEPEAQRIPAPAGRRWPRQVWQAAASDRWAMRLWAAVLIDAITALRGVHPEGRAGSKGAAYNADRRERLRLQARRWVRARDRGWLGAFECVCDALEIDVDTVRQDLLSIGVEK